MANKYVMAGVGNGKFSIAAGDASATLVLGSPSKRIVGTIAVDIRVASGTLSLVVKARSNHGQAGKGNDDIAFLPIPYVKQYLNGAVGDQTYVSTAITGNSIILIPATGLEIALDLTQTNGVADVYVRNIEGAAA